MRKKMGSPNCEKTKTKTTTENKQKPNPNPSSPFGIPIDPLL
jgi:hypothetical protein